MKKTFFAILAFVFTCFTACDDSENLPEQPADPQPNHVTEENYALAETQVIFTGYVSKIAQATKTNGTGILIHKRQTPDPTDKTIVRINFDTRYSFAILDLTTDATLVLPETDGRYQSAWFITEEHYNPMGINNPGTYKITQKDMGSRYVMVVVRTQVNMADEKDMAAVSALQNKIKLIQEEKGEYVASYKWDMDEILQMRKKYQQIMLQQHITADKMFGKKGEVDLVAHNCGVAAGWGGMTPEQSVYVNYVPKDENPYTLTLKDVPVADNAFWSITVYDENGFVKEAPYNINSSFAKTEPDGSAIIHFGGDESANNYLRTFKGWNFVLRLYVPTEAVFNGSWKKPELVPAN